MEEETGRNWSSEKPKRNDAYNKVVRAGKRTYFLDVRTTPEEEFFVVITESKKCIDEDGRFFYEKHKIYVYPEDLEALSNGLNHVVNFFKGKKNKNQFFTKHFKESLSSVNQNVELLEEPQLEESFAGADLEHVENQ